MATILHPAIPESPATPLLTGTWMERATRGLAVLTGFSIPLSTSFSEITTGLFVACWLLSGNMARNRSVIRRNAVALLSLSLFGLLLVGIAWSNESVDAAGRCLLKYRELVYLPIFIVVFRDVRLRTLATAAFLLGAVLLLGLSYFEWLSSVDLGLNAHALDLSPVISKDRIIHSLIMALLAYLSAVRFAALAADPAPDARPSRPWRLGLYAGIIGLAAFNILVMVRGRTGYLLLGALTALFLFERLGRRGLALACLLLGALAWCGLLFSDAVQQRVENTLCQLENQFGPERRHSLDPRLEFYENALRLIRRHPLLGTGTGSFRGEYARLIANTDDRPTSDPHNEYLNLACQVGIAGPLLFIALLTVQWLSVGRLPAVEMHTGRGIVLTIALGSLFNSLILSVTGGLIYAYFSGIAFAELSQTEEADALRIPQGRAGEQLPAQQRLAA